MDYQLFDDLERDMEERHALLQFDRVLNDMAPEREAQQLIAQMTAEEETSLTELEQLYHSLLRQNYNCEDRPGPQIACYEDGLRARLLRETSCEQDYGDQFARAVDATIRKVLFGQFCASLSRVQHLTYLLICLEKSAPRRSAGV